MNVYLYIAQNNPDAAFEVCKKYGYFQINSIDELANCLQLIVSQDGEESFYEVMCLHPDKEVLLELFDKKKAEYVVEPTPAAPTNPIAAAVESIIPQKECSCKSGADGTTSVVNQTNTFILLGAVIVSIAIISMNKSKG